MIEINPRPAIYGKNLKDEIHSQPTERLPLIEGLLYEKSVVMCSADPGVGKSVLTANLIASASCGLPLFGHLNIPKPFKVYYIPSERGKEEIYERLKPISDTIPINYDYIYINEDFIGYNVIDQNCADAIVHRIKEDSFDVKLIILDPIYSFVAGGLSTDEKASQFVRFSARLQKEFEASIWMNHHNVKETYDQTGKAINKSDPFYGSIWLKAHCTAGYLMQRRDNDNPTKGIKLTCKKDAHSNLIKLMELGFNPDDYTLYLDSTDKSLKGLDRLKIYLRTKWNSDNKNFYYTDLETCLTGVSHASLRRYLIHPEIAPHLTTTKSSGLKTLYTISSAI